MEVLKKVFFEERGEDVIEYGLILVLVALAVVAGANLLGVAFNDLYTALASAVVSIPG